VRLQGKSDRRGLIVAVVVVLAIAIAVAVYLLYFAPAT
jgi:hypothetical protein